MKKLLFIFIAIVSTHCSYGQDRPYTAIAFYNLENFFDTINNPNKLDDDFTPNGPYANSSAVFNKKVENLSTVIALLGMDKSSDGIAFLGCAEVENETVLKALVNSPKLRDRHYKFVIFDGPDERGINCGFIYNPKLFKVLEAKSLTVNLGIGERPTRDVLYVTGKLNGEIVHVFVNHWPSRSGGESASRPKRNLAAAVSKKVIDSLMKVDPMTKVVVMGDLNDDPTNESVAKILAAKGNVKDVKSGELFNPWVSFYKKGLGTMAYQDSWSLFDQVMISYGFVANAGSGAHYKEAEVFNRNFMVEKDGQYKGYPKRSYTNSTWNDGYSDHFPAVVFLTK